MYIKSNLLNYLFFDIETKPKWKSFDEIPKPLQKIWLEKYHFKAYEKEIEARQKKLILDSKISISGKTITANASTVVELPSINEIYIKEAGLHAEYAEILCISFGVFDKDFNKTVNTIQDESEKVIIEQFLQLLKHFGQN